ncbi:MAG: hypothetical protein LBG48_04665, partial [Rickettsiales bacterium]|nr:hypothetical protein [Rickettsiales bacterium]
MFFRKNFVNKKTKYFESSTYLLLSIPLIFSIIFVKENIFNWIATIISTFAILGNDSPQLVGTYLASKKDEKWQKTFLFVGFILVIVILYGWYFDGGEIHFKILDNVTPRQINIYYVMAPIVLL